MSGTSRRCFLASGTAALFAARRLSGAAFDDRMGAILDRIKPPRFPDREFAITRFGAKPGVETDSTQAIRQAVEACSKAGGGRVVVPAGVYLTGAIHLKSGVNLHVTRDATLKFSTEPGQFLPVVPTRWEGSDLMNYSPLIYAYEQNDIAVTGEGTLDGQAGCEAWWPMAGKGPCKFPPANPNQKTARDRLIEMASRRVPVEQRVFGEGHYLRPNFIQPHRCKNVLIEGVTILNSPMWEVHPLFCENVTVRRVKINSHGPNNDGCDPESCKDVLIEGCEFDTGDDCIAIKSGRNEDGRRVPVPTENVVIRNCVMKAGHGGVTIGSEITAGVKHVYVDGCEMSSPDLNQGLRFKNNAARGGVIEHIYARNIRIGQVGVAVEVDFNYEEGAKGAYKPVVRDVLVSGLNCKQAKSPWILRGLPGAPVENVRFENCTFEKAAKDPVADHVEGLVLDHVKVNGRVL